MKIIQSTYKKNQGLSLIEMMVSMVLGLFLVLGLSSMYINSQKSDKVRAAVSEIEENARMALNNLRAALEHAGYKTPNNIPLEKPFQTSVEGAISNKICKEGENLISNSNLLTPPTEYADYTNDGNVANLESDFVTVIYSADNPATGPIYFDCSGVDGAYGGDAGRQTSCSADTANGGMNNSSDSKIYNGIFVRKSDHTLRCAGSRSPAGSIELAENVVNMQIRYGVMTTDVNGQNTTEYLKASEISDDDWYKITSIQVAIMMASDRDVLDQAKAHEIELLDETISLSADRKLYRTFSTTIHLPNRSRRELQSVTRAEAEAT